LPAGLLFGDARVDDAGKNDFRAGMRTRGGLSICRGNFRTAAAMDANRFDRLKVGDVGFERFEASTQ
jgi:hypothetical protein